MYCMFANCRELLTLDLTTFDTRKVTNMANMFVSGEEVKPMKIQIIELGENFVTSNVTNMNSMFGNCNYLTTLDVSNFDTSNVLYMNDMFASCYSLTNIDVSNWDTSKVTNMHGMFFSCRNVTKLNLCSFDTSNVKDMSVMFAYNYTLKNVYVGPNWTTANANTANMFTGSSVSSVTTGQC